MHSTVDQDDERDDDLAEEDQLGERGGGGGGQFSGVIRAAHKQMALMHKGEREQRLYLCPRGYFKTFFASTVVSKLAYHHKAVHGNGTTLTLVRNDCLNHFNTCWYVCSRRKVLDKGASPLWVKRHSLRQHTPCQAEVR